jgi:adenylate cyclase
MTEEQPVADYSNREVAEQAGVDPEYVGRLLELGLLGSAQGEATAGGAVRRVRMIVSLERAGIALTDLASAVNDGVLSFAFLDLPVFDRFAGGTATTFRGLSAETGIPLELAMVIREAAGFAQPDPDDHVREYERRIAELVQRQLGRRFRAAVIERWLRVYGDSLRRVAETEAAWWRTEVERPLIESGVGEGEVLDVAAKWGMEIAPLLDQALLALYHGHQEHAWLKNIIDNFESALTAAGLRTTLHHPPAVCFLDIAGYTRLTEEQGDQAAAQLAARLAQLVQRTAQRHGGKPVKWLGDGVMFYFREPAQGVVAALEMLVGVTDAGLPPAHVGLHTGPVVFQEGDYFGRTVNIAARIADYARPGEVLVSQDVVDASGQAALTFREIGPVELKGVAGVLRLHAAHPVGPDPDA